MSPSAATPPLVGAIELFDILAADYDAHFAVPTRRAYDDLAWEATTQFVPRAPGVIVDAGCGIGRWSGRFLDAGHRTIGLEPSPAMAAKARQRLTGRTAFALMQVPMEHAEIAECSADLVVAMGSLQYTADPVAILGRLASWVAPGGAVCVLVDSLVSLCLELSRAGRDAESLDRARTRRGVWEQHGRRTELHLFDAAALRDAAADAGLTDVAVHGLLVGFSLLGGDGLRAALAADTAAQLDRERTWTSVPALTDLGKQLLLTARRPATGDEPR